MKNIAFMTSNHTVIVHSGGFFKNDTGFITFDGALMKEGTTIALDGINVSYHATKADTEDFGMKGGHKIVGVCRFNLEGVYLFDVYLIENHFNPLFPDRESHSQYYRRFLDFNAAIIDQSRDPHGILGQTAHIRPQDKGRSLINWDIDGTAVDYLVKDGLTGSKFQFNRFAH